MRRELSNQPRPIAPTHGERITIRTLHPFDRRGGQRNERPPFTLDGLVTCTMPVVRAMRDDEPVATRVVRL